MTRSPRFRLITACLGTLFRERRAGTPACGLSGVGMTTSEIKSGDEVDAASDERLAACVGDDLGKVEVVREAVAGLKAGLQPQAEPVLPEYEG
jgi:hypothetical protein